MSLIKKADVNDHLAARRRKRLFPFKPISQPDATGYSGGGSREARLNERKSRQGYDRELSSVRPSVTASESHVVSVRSVDTSTVKKVQA
jgi:hypothetical protein